MSFVFWLLLGLVLGVLFQIGFPSVPPFWVSRSARAGALLGLLGIVIYWLAPKSLLFVRAWLPPAEVAIALSGVVLGWLAGQHRDKFSEIARDLFDAFLGNTEHSPWALQASFAIIVALAFAFAAKPDLIDKIESFKAGDLEAKFATSASKIRDVRIVNLKSSHLSEVIIQWHLFDLFKDRDGKYLPPTNYLDEKATGVTPRLALMRVALAKLSTNGSYWQIDIEKKLFENHVYPIIGALHCLFTEGRLGDVRSSQSVIELATSLERLVKNQDAPQFEQQLKNALREVATMQSALQKQALAHVVDLPREDYLSFASKDRRQDVQSCVEAENAVKSGKMANTDAEADEIIKLFKSRNAGRDEHPFFEGYLVTVVADFIALTRGQAQKAEFLQEFKAKYPLSAGDGRIPLPGNVNLYSQLLDARINGIYAWPIQEAFREMVDLRIATDITFGEISKELASADDARKPLWKEVDALYRFNRILDLTQSLQFFNETTLSGMGLRPEHKAFWKKSYDESREILSVLGKAPAVAETIEDDEKAKWLAALPTIEQTTGDPYYDLLHTAALSTILIPEQDGHTSGGDCAAAGALVSSLEENLSEALRNRGIGYSEWVSRAGYVDQISGRVAISCGNR